MNIRGIVWDIAFFIVCLIVWAAIMSLQGQAMQVEDAFYFAAGYIVGLGIIRLIKRRKVT